MSEPWATAQKHLDTWKHCASAWKKAIWVPTLASADLARSISGPGLALADRLVCAPVNAMSLAAGALGSAAGFVIGQGLFVSDGRPAGALGAIIGANVGVWLVREAAKAILCLTFAAASVVCGAGAFLCAGAVSIAASPVTILWLKSTPKTTEFTPVTDEIERQPPAMTPVSRDFARTWIASLNGQGDPSCASLENFRISAGPDGNTDTFAGEVRMLFGLKKVHDVNGVLKYDEEGTVSELNLCMPAGIFNEIEIRARPYLCQDRMHLTGEARGFHYAGSKPIDQELEGQGFTKGLTTESEPFVVSFAKHGPDGSEQEISYYGPWSGGYTMGPVDLHHFPLATAAHLGLGIALEC